MMPATLVLGSAADFVTFRSINIEATFWILGMYYVVAGLCIVILNKVNHERIRIFSKFLIQFTFGALLSASLVFYWFSGSISASWPIMILLAIFMVSNEVFNHYYLKPVIQVSVFYFVSFSLLALALPYAFNSLNPMLFLSAGIGSFIFVLICLKIFTRFEKTIFLSQNKILFVMAMIFVAMQALYFGNIIPPIPLSLREAGVYHNIERSGRFYSLLVEKEAWWDKFVPGQTIHISKSNRLYVYSSIFAPTKLHTTIVHHWQWFDSVEKKWIDKDRLTFTLSGGRDEGYRGYSMKSNVPVGKWRVRMETERGQVIGSIGFNVVETGNEPELEQIIK